MTSMDADTFSVRWTGKVKPQYTGTYTFYTSSDDGVRLWVNNQLIINKWVDQATTEWSGTIQLTAGQKYDIKLEYYDNTEDAIAKLSWSSPLQAKQIIPQNRLYLN
ncbi:PA14 domain-containing protein [Paenibacillus sp. 2TAB26]